jgi:thioredoxin reductase
MPDPVVVVGAGAAGLATARALSRARIPYRLLERGALPGQTWHDLYDSLRLHTGRHLSALPGMRMPRGTPLFPTRLDYHEYLRDYARRFELNVETGCDVTHVERNREQWIVRAGGAEIVAGGVVVATGIVSNPHIPDIAGRNEFEAHGGRILHSVEYRNPAPFIGRRVLVVGIGNSGGEIGSELARAGVDVTIAVRSGANVVPLTVGGIPVQYLSTVIRKLPRAAQERLALAVKRLGDKRRGPSVLPPSPKNPLDAVPLIGFHLIDEIRAGRARVRPGLAHFTAGGVTFGDGSAEPFDVVILATGFRPATGMLGDRIRRDSRGFAVRSDRVTSADAEGLFFVGHNYDSRGGLLNIAVDAPVAAKRLAKRA